MFWKMRGQSAVVFVNLFFPEEVFVFGAEASANLLW